MQTTHTLGAIVTTSDRSRRYRLENEELAIAMAERLAIPYVPRNNYSLGEMRKLYEVDNILVTRRGLVELETSRDKLFFHPGLAHLRIKNLRLKKSDHLVTAMDIKVGDNILDCTLGMGADSLVMAYAVGDAGSVTALEASPLIEAVIGHGLAHGLGENYDIHQAMRRIKTHAIDALAFLTQTAAKSYDSIYFDPMFRHPFYESSSLNALRDVADNSPLTTELIKEACRVARKRVVMKETSLSSEFQRLGFTKIVGGKYSKIHYGVMEI